MKNPLFRFAILPAGLLSGAGLRADDAHMAEQPCGVPDQIDRWFH